MEKVSVCQPYKLKVGQKIYMVIKAILDFFCALLALIVLSPLFIVIAIAIKIDSKGPVFFKQERIGRGGKKFNCIKFRSMTTNVNHYLATYDNKDSEAYITKVGAFIRKTSIDELPQIFNILTFQMSWIGFRPTIPQEKELDDTRMKYGVYQLTPGISGWAQVNGRDVLASHPKDKAKFDEYYLEHFSFWFDIKIFFMTIVKVFKKEGIQEGTLNDTNDNSIETENVEEILGECK